MSRRDSSAAAPRDDCTGCQRPARTVPARFAWQEPFVMQLCWRCVAGLVLAPLTWWARRVGCGSARRVARRPATIAAGK